MSSLSHDEKRLLLQIAEGDETAFTTLFHQYKQQIYAYALRFTRNVSLAEEIVQDVFLKIWVHRQSLPEVDRFEAYIYVTARNISFNCLKKMAREKARQENWDGEAITILTATEEEVHTDYKRIIIQAVDRLPPRQKLIYTLRHERGLKYDEIAQHLQISPNTVKVHLVQALRSIRSHLISSGNNIVAVLFFLDLFS